MSRICLYYRLEPTRDRWISGDRFVRPLLRRILRGNPRPSGVDKVFINLCLGLDKLGINYEVNLPFNQLKDDDRVGLLGCGEHCLDGYSRPNPVVAGIGLMTHPSEWPSLCDDYPVVKYLQHSEWANNVYIPYYGGRCGVWPVGIDTDKWDILGRENKITDFLVYDKIRWNYDKICIELKNPILEELRRRKLTYEVIRYGYYQPADFQQALKRCRAMIFLCEHESQGLAYQECLSSNVPILAWDQGWCLDPNRFKWGQSEIPATSVPFFDSRCGGKFQAMDDFPTELDCFLHCAHQGSLRPRDYILENLTLDKCSKSFVSILDAAANQ